MTRFAYLAAALAAATILPAAAQAADQSVPVSGHYEWRVQPQFGPRAPLAAPRRVWVADGAEAASCNCPMMAASRGQAG